MSRFSISLLCEQVYNICRLCGVDNPDKIPIIGAEDVVFIAESGEPTLAQKIELCVGIKVTSNDQMPQKICSLCVDKMNDFYEYRAMCENTDVQTRKFLHLPLVAPAALLVPKIEPEISAVITLDDDEEEDVKPNIKRGPKTRNRKKQTESDEPGNSEETDSKSFLDAPSEKRAKYEFPCQYCNESYSQNTELDRHLVVKHTPLVHKFGCGSCMEYFDTATEFKDHNLWHKLTRTSFGCFRCGKKFAKISTLNKHVSLNACIRQPRVSHQVTLVPDMQCRVCHKVFKTRNLYEWHGCFIRSRTNCPKCGKHFIKKNLLIRHFMLYCSGTIPFLDPIVFPKDEPSSGSVNGQPGSLPASGGTEVKRRGRPSKTRAAESMKEETIDLPLPPLLDLPDVKSEFNSTQDGHNSSEGTVSGTEMGEIQKRSSLIEETDKITTLLRSGESVDGNTDINTINSMLSSVNEAIATISKVRKKKKKRGRLSSSGAGNAGEASEKSNPPMVVLSKANVKQEVDEDSNMFAALIANSSGVENGLNEAPNVDQQEAEGAESDHGDYDNVADSFAHHNDDGGDSDSDVEIISVEQYQPVGSGTMLPTNWNDAMQSNSTRPLETAIASEPIGLQVKQEPMASNDGDESDFEGYEDASMFVAVKQELIEETVDAAPIEQSAAKEKEPEASFSSYQALRIKIKKEKGLLNASVVGEVEESVPADPISTPEQNSDEPANKRPTREHIKAKKTIKPSTKRNNNPPTVKRCLRTSTLGLNVSIKQEPMEQEHANEEELHESVTDPEHEYPPEEPFIDTTVRIKQEPQEDDTRPDSASETHPADDVITFDGKRIKRERPDDDLASHKRQACSNDSFRKSLNPLSLSGVRIAAGKKSANSQSGVSANKSSVMINPFALLKQKESVPTVTEQPAASKDSTDSLAGQSAERFGLPVISQVKSIDPVEHLSLTSVDTAAAEPTPVVEQQQQETTAEMDQSDGTDNNLRHTDSSPSPEPSGSEPVAVAASSASPQANVSELKITSVTTIPEDVVPPQENVTELRIASATAIPEDVVLPQENVSELRITSATTVPEDNLSPQKHATEFKITEVTKGPEDVVLPQQNIGEIKISSVTTIPQDIVHPHQNTTELKVSSVTTMPEDIVHPQQNTTELKVSSVTTIPEDIVPPQQNTTELKVSSVTTMPEDIVPPQQNTTDLKVSSVTTIPEGIVPPQEHAKELKITSATSDPDDIVSPQENIGELKISSVTTIAEDVEEESHSQDQYSEQQTPADDADSSDANAIPPSDASEHDELEDLTPQQVTKDAETSSGSVVKNHIEAVDSCKDDGKRTLDHHDDDDEQKTLNNEEEEQVVSVASEASEKMPEDKAAASTDDEEQEPNDHDTVAAVASGNIDTTAESDEADINITTATCSQQQKEPPSDESSLDEVLSKGGSQTDFCAVPSNDEVLVAKQ